LLNIVIATEGKHILRYADSQRPEVRSKPHGVTHLEVFVTICPMPTNLADPMQGTFVGTFTRAPFTVEFKPEADGKVATYYARWAGKVGPWSLPVSIVVCGGRRP